MVRMKPRYLASAIHAFCFPEHKMSFISGPRQCGKTTLAKMLLRERGAGQYYNWDAIEFRRLWTKSPHEVVAAQGLPTHPTPVIVLDEIHKAKGWKRTLKGMFDTVEHPVDILVTGSARLATFTKGGDSLMGRYFHFRLHPFTVREVANLGEVAPAHFLEQLFASALSYQKLSQEVLRIFMRYGGFPEPFLQQDQRRLRMWQQGRIEKIIREDLRDMSRIPELSQIEMLTSLLPERVGSLFSRASLREDLEVSFDTVKRWLHYLMELFYFFEVKPYQRQIVRSLKKEGKIYLWDYSEVPHEAARFENLVAAHLLKTVHYWTDTGYGNFDLWYLRNKEKQEIDFLITRDRQPWLPVEVKLTDVHPSPHWHTFLAYLPCRFALQIVLQPDAWKEHRIGETRLLVVSAARALPYFM